MKAPKMNCEIIITTTIIAIIIIINIIIITIIRVRDLFNTYQVSAGFVGQLY